MRIGSCEVLFIRQNRCPEFDLCIGAGNSRTNYDLGEGNG